MDDSMTRNIDPKGAGDYIGGFRDMKKAGRP